MKIHPEIFVGLIRLWLEFFFFSLHHKYCKCNECKKSCKCNRHHVSMIPSINCSFSLLWYNQINFYSFCTCYSLLLIIRSSISWRNTYYMNCICLSNCKPRNNRCCTLRVCNNSLDNLTSWILNFYSCICDWIASYFISDCCLNRTSNRCVIRSFVYN